MQKHFLYKCHRHAFLARRIRHPSGRWLVRWELEHRTVAPGVADAPIPQMHFEAGDHQLINRMMIKFRIQFFT